MKLNKMNKKGVFFNIFLVIIMFISLVYAYTVLNEKYKEAADERELGELQTKTAASYQDAENTLNYIDYSAKIASNRALFTIAAKGGFRDEMPCGMFEGKALWNSNNEACAPNFAASYADAIKDTLEILYLPNCIG